MNYYKEHNIFPTQPKYFNHEIDSVHIKANLTFDQISKVVNVPGGRFAFPEPDVHQRLGTRISQTVPAEPAAQRP